MRLLSGRLWAVKTGLMAVNSDRDQPRQQISKRSMYGYLRWSTPAAFQHVEDVEGIPHGLAVEQAIAERRGLTGNVLGHTRRRVLCG